MEAATAWVLNLDADLELAAPERYTPTKSVRAAMAENVARVRSLLMRPHDVLVDEDSAPGAARGLVGRAFCPTPRAVALLDRAGAQVEPHPSLAVLREVNARSFATKVGPLLPGAAFVTEGDVARAMLDAAPPLGLAAAWRVKRQHGMAGRRQRLVAPGRRSAADDAFVDSGLAEGGVQIEPNVTIVQELAKHGRLAQGSGVVELGALVRQRCDARGVWIASEAIDVRSAEDEALDRELADQARVVAGALSAAGYFGPFGIDAFTYRDAGGTTRLHRSSEINARYSMGFGVGFPLHAAARRDATW